MKHFIKHITQLNLPIAILLLVVCVALWIPDIINAIGQEPTTCTLIWIPQTFSVRITPLLLVILTLAVTILTAISLMGLLYNSGVLHERNMMPAIFYLLITGCATSLHYRLSFQIGAMLFIAALLILYSVYRQPAATEQIFLATIIIMIGSMFLPDLLWFVFFVWIALPIERALSLKMWLASVIAIATVATYTAIGLYFFGDEMQRTSFEIIFQRSFPQIEMSGPMIIQIIYFLLSVALIVYYYMTRARLNIQNIVAGDLFVLTAFIVAALSCLPPTEISILPIGALTICAMSVHYFSGQPSVMRGSLFIVYIISHIIYWAL